MNVSRLLILSLIHISNDYVIISATPIPGNEKMVGNVVNELMKRDIDVYKRQDVNMERYINLLRNDGVLSVDNLIERFL